MKTRMLAMSMVFGALLLGAQGCAKQPLKAGGHIELSGFKGEIPKVGTTIRVLDVRHYNTNTASGVVITWQYATGDIQVHATTTPGWYFTGLGDNGIYDVVPDVEVPVGVKKHKDK